MSSISLANFESMDIRCLTEDLDNNTFYRRGVSAFAADRLQRGKGQDGSPGDDGHAPQSAVRRAQKRCIVLSGFHTPEKGGEEVIRRRGKADDGGDSVLGSGRRGVISWTAARRDQQ